MVEFDNAVAEKEGWRLIVGEPLFAGFPPEARIARLHIARATDFGFATDDDAADYVAAEAALGSPLHQKAMSMIRDFESALARLFR